MPNYLLKLRFDGREFHGYQIQAKPFMPERTVGEELKKALITVFGEVTNLAGCSRTDAGVHATGYCVSFTSERHISCDSVVKAVNANLPFDIAVYACRNVSDNFHARYSVVSKQYTYKIYTSPVRDPFHNGLMLHCNYVLDAVKLNTASKDFIGTHDFRAFMASGSTVTNTVRTVYEAGFKRISDNMFVFTVSANGFLYNMVRIMVGTLLDIQSGKITANGIPSIISGCDRRFAGHTAPPDGLYLTEVKYDQY